MLQHLPRVALYNEIDSNMGGGIRIEADDKQNEREPHL